MICGNSIFSILLSRNSELLNIMRQLCNSRICFHVASCQFDHEHECTLSTSAKALGDLSLKKTHQSLPNGRTFSQGQGDRLNCTLAPDLVIISPQLMVQPCDVIICYQLSSTQSGEHQA